MQLGLSLLRSDRRTADAPVGAASSARLGGLLEEIEIRGVRLERDDDACATGEGVRPVVPLVRAEVENDGSAIVRAVGVVDDDPSERLRSIE